MAGAGTPGDAAAESPMLEKKPPSLLLESTQLVVMSCLFAFHALADIMLGVLHAQGIELGWVDWLSLPAAQLCLLGFWLAAGSGRFSIRLALAIVAASSLFTIVATIDFSVRYDVAKGVYWLQEEWHEFFRPHGPGHLLVQAPLLTFGVAIPLLAARLLRSVRRGPRGWFRWPGVWFGMHDLLAWTAAASAVLAVVFQTAPHEGWCRQLVEHWRLQYAEFDRPLAAAAAGGTANALLAVAAIAAVWIGTKRLRILCFVFLLAAALLAEWALRRNFPAPVGSPVVTAVAVCGSLQLLRMYAAASEKDALKRTH